MVPRTTVLAQKLKAFRAAHGQHGRLTQEALAERLGLSVDAIGKYERGVSFPRGDLEHRFVERLGWSAEDMATARSDWDLVQRGASGVRYRLADEADADTLPTAIMELADMAFPDVPDGFLADRAVWLPILNRFPNHGGVVFHGPDPVAHWGLQFLPPEDEALFRERRFEESTLDAETLRRPLLPGSYFAYCPAVVVAAGHEAAAPLLLRSFVDFIERLARRDIRISGIGAATTSAEGRQFCQDLAFQVLGPHRRYPKVQMCVLSPGALAGGILGKRSALIRRVYGEQPGA
jgi:DNA-binding XRE family transcriptional regulator